MRLLLFGFVSTFLVCANAESLAVVPKKAIVLFNGKDFDGWYPYLRENKYKDPNPGHVPHRFPHRFSKPKEWWWIKYEA